MTKEEIRKLFEATFDIPEFITFDGDDYVSYNDDPVDNEYTDEIQAKYRGFQEGFESAMEIYKGEYNV